MARGGRALKSTFMPTSVEGARIVPLGIVTIVATVRFLPEWDEDRACRVADALFALRVLAKGESRRSLAETRTARPARMMLNAKAVWRSGTREQQECFPWKFLCAGCKGEWQLESRPIRMMVGWQRLQCPNCHVWAHVGGDTCCGCRLDVKHCECRPGRPQPAFSDRARRLYSLLGMR